MPLSLSRDTLPLGAALGRVELPGSKSVTNRALLLAGMAPGTSTLRGALEAEDTRWMAEALGSLGIPLTREPAGWVIEGGRRPEPSGPLWLGASGTTLRFLLPWLALRATGPVEVRGEPRLFERPLDPLVRALEHAGAVWEPGPAGGWLHPAPSPGRIELEVDGALSSQFVSGLAMAAANLPGGGVLHWTRPVASASYLALTARWLRAFGCASSLQSDRWQVPGNQLRPAVVDLPADWSGAAAFLAAAAVTGRTITVGPLDPDDAQRDRDLVGILESSGCRSRWEGDRLTLSGPLLRGIHADLEASPDLGPVLAATAALVPAASVITGLQTLPLKECDRLDASAELVGWLGGRAEVEGNHTLRIQPGPAAAVARPPFNPRRDHRMAFAAAVGGLLRGGTLQDPACVAKTFPDFWDRWARMLTGRP
jgi:3-phosphoshikimate 1-carboxyvinyltransferase